MTSPHTKLKQIAIKFRNHFLGGNRFVLDRASAFNNNANIRATSIYSSGKNTIYFATHTRLTNATIVIRGHGNSLIINESAHFTGHIELIGNGNSIVIGAHSKINGAFLLAHNGTRIAIGNGCLFSQNIDIRTTDSHKIMDSSGRQINCDKNIEIGDRVWLGLGAHVMKGAHIEHDCVIGACSVVTGKIEANCLSAGVPARVLQTGITWQE